MAAQPFILTIDGVRPFCYSDYSTTSYFEKRQDFFICSTHRVNKDKCSGHYIRAVVLEQIVWKHIQEVISVVTRYEAYFRSEMEQKLRIQSEESLRLY